MNDFAQRLRDRKLVQWALANDAWPESFSNNAECFSASLRVRVREQLISSQASS